MTLGPAVALFLTGAIAGAVLVWIVSRGQRHIMESFIERAKNELRDATATRAGERVGELVAPVAQKLGEFDRLVHDLESARQREQGGLREQIASLLARTDKLELAATRLSSDTKTLVSALREPKTRGRWGEIQLRNVLEHAGMLEYCHDFAEQPTIAVGDERRRPDVEVRLPNGGRIFIDAKVPLDRFLDAIDETDDERRRALLAEHARALRDSAMALAKRGYQTGSDSVDFVVMFVPGESFLSAACHEYPQLIEEAVERGVLIASPLTLIALLRSYAIGWSQRRQEENAKEIAAAGRELYDRVRVFVGHLAAVGSGLHKALLSYNAAIGSLESRLLPQGRKLKEIAALPDAELPEMQAIDSAPREITALDADVKRQRLPRSQRLFGNDA